MPSIRTAAETTVLRVLYALPAPVVRRLAGRPVVREGNTLDPEIQLLLRLQKLSGGGLDKPSVAEGRASMAKDALLVGGDQPIGLTEDLKVEGAEGVLPARLYVPRSLLESAEPAPLLVYFHGGGMAYGDLETHDPVCRFLAERAGVKVISVDYRLAPEHPFPASPEDAWAATRWVAANAAALGADRARLAVGGDSAGGCLAALVAVRAAKEKVPLRFQLLVYPATRWGDSGKSRQTFAENFLLTDEAMTHFETMFLAGSKVGDPAHSVGHVKQLPQDMAKALVVVAGFDPLRDEDKDYVAMLQKAGVDVTEKYYPSFTHGFFNMVGAPRTPRAAVAEIAAELRAALV
jgi:acetyl esterase